MSNQSTDEINTLRLSQHEITSLLEKFDQDQPDSPSPDREFVRWTYRVCVVDLLLEHASGSKVTLPVATRNISRGGISILHSAYIHTNSPCEIRINLPDNETIYVKGKVARCKHLDGRIHEIGIAFDEQISTKELLGLDPLNEAYSLERIDPDRLLGSVLIVSPTELECELMLLFLSDTNLNLSTADNIENAITRAAKGCDLIVTDFHIGEHTAIDLIDTLHDQNLDMPVIVLTSDKSETMLDTIRDTLASGILSKPISKDRLMQALAEFLHADGDGGPLYSTLTTEDSAFPLLAKFLTNVPRIALDLEKALREENINSCIQICRSLCGTSIPLGFPSISAFATLADKKLATGNISSAATDIRAIIVECRRIKSKPAA